MTDSETPCSRSNGGNARAINPEGRPCAKYRADSIPNKGQPPGTTAGGRSASRLPSIMRLLRSISSMLPDARPEGITMSDELLPDGGEKGLSGHNLERMPRRRVGLAPPAGVIDRRPPYKRIATEEAWTFPALVKAQVDYLDSGDAPDDYALQMGGMFARNANLQRMLQDLGALRLAHMDEYGIDRQLLLLTAPGVQVVRHGDGTALARDANDIAANACRRHSG